MRLHLDTDFAGDPDDACALAMLLGWPGVELTGITTASDPGGRRAGYVGHLLDLAGRTDIPVAAGAEVSMTTLQVAGDIPDDDRYWPRSIRPRPSPPGAAFDLLDQSIGMGATVVAVGPFTNLALLEVIQPGRLGQVPVVTMGGWFEGPPAGLPQFGPGDDYNVQCDTTAAGIVASAAHLTIVSLAVTAQVHLRTAHLGRLQSSGTLGRLLGSQALAHADDYDQRAFARAHDGLPDDLLNFQHDPLACAVAAGWSGAVVETRNLGTVTEGGVLRFAEDVQGARPVDVVVAIDADDFAESWLQAVEAAQRAPGATR